MKSASPDIFAPKEHEKTHWMTECVANEAPFTKDEINARATAYFSDPLISGLPQQDPDRPQSREMSFIGLIGYLLFAMWWLSSVPFVAFIAVVAGIYTFIQIKTSQYRERHQNQSASRAQGRV